MMRQLRIQAPALAAASRSRLACGRGLATTRAAAATTTRAAAATTGSTPASTSAPANWRPGATIRMLYDGECSLCMKEVSFLRKRDAGAGRIEFVDIAGPAYSPHDNAGITFQAAMERIHALLPDGTIVRDVEVFRLLYEAVGLGWVYAITKHPAVLNAANGLYGVWAKYRTNLTGRESLEVILQRHREQTAAGSLCRSPDGSPNDSQACELPAASQQK